MLYLNEILWNVNDDEHAGTRTVELPDSVEATNLLSYLSQRYDADPLDLVSTEVPQLGQTTVGWSFPLPDGLSDLDPDDHEVLAVPLVRLGDGGLVPLFVKLAQDRAELEDMVGSGKVDSMHVVELESEEWTPDPLERGRELLKRATVATDRANYADAGRLLDEAEGLVRGVDDELLADVLYQRGYLELRLGDPDAALDRFDEAHRGYREAGSDDEIWARVSAANALSDLGRYDEALARYADARERIVELDESQALATLEMEIGLTLARTGQPRAARDRYERALAGYEEHGSEVDVARCLQNLGSTLKDLGHVDEAIDAHRRAREIYRRYGMRSHEVDCDVNIAHVRWQQGHWQRAIEAYERARAAYEELGLPTEVADCDDGIGALLTELGRPEEAEELHRRALAAYREHGELPVEAAICERNLGHTLDHLGEHDGARAHIAAAREVFEEAGADDEVSECDLYLAHAASSVGDTDGALELVERARRIWERARPGESAPGCDLTAGEVLVSAGRHSEAIAPLERALDLYEDAGNRAGQAEAALNVARALAGDGDADTAERELVRARELFSTMEAGNRVAECDELRDRLT